MAGTLPPDDYFSSSQPQQQKSMGTLPPDDYFSTPSSNMPVEAPNMPVEARSPEPGPVPQLRPEAPGEALMAPIVGAGNKLQQLGRSAATLGAEGLSKVGLMDPATAAAMRLDALTKQTHEENISRQLQQNHPTGYATGKFIGSMLPAAATMPAAGAGFAARLGINTLAGTAQGALESDVAGGSPAQGGFLGGATAAAMTALPAALRGVRNFTQRGTQAGAQRAVGTSLLENTSGVQQRAANQLGREARQAGLPTNLTPGELTNSAPLLGDEGRLAVTSAARTAIDKSNIAMTDQIKTKLAGQLQQYAKGADQVDELYKAAFNKTVPKEAVQKMVETPHVAQAMKQAESALANQLDGVPKDSVKYWDLIKQQLDDTYESLAKSEMKGKAAKDVLLSKQKILNILDEAVPGEYQAAREAAQKNIIKEKWLPALTEEDATIPTLYKKLFGKEKIKAEFIKDMTKAGIPKSHLATVEKVMARVSKSKFRKLSEKAVVGSDKANVRGISKGGVSERLLQKSLDVLKGRYTEALPNILLDPKKWGPAMKAVKSERNMAGFINQLNDVVQRANTSLKKEEK